MIESCAELPQWDLAALYPSVASPSFRRDVRTLGVLFRSTTDAANSLVSPSVDPAMQFDRAMTLLDQTMSLAWRLDSFVAAILDTDAKNPDASAVELELRSLLDPLADVRRRLVSWAADDAPALLAERSMTVGQSAAALARLAEDARRRLPDREEELVAELGRTGAAAWSRLRRTVTASMQATWVEGTIDKSGTISELHAATNLGRVDRRSSYETECALWADNALPLASALNGVKGEARVLAARRGWASPLDEMLWRNGLDRDALDQLLAAVDRTLPAFRRFLRIKAGLLGSPTLSFSEIDGPLGSPPRLTFVAAAGLITDAFRNFDPAMGALAERAVVDRWIDARAHPGRQSGGLCYWLGGGRSLLRVEHRPGYDGVRMLAHELGHAHHAAVLASARRPAWEIEAIPLPLWETTSKLCEQLARGEMEQRAHEPHELLGVVDGHLTALYRSVVEAVVAFRFEERLFADGTERDLSVEELNDLIVTIRADLVGDALDGAVPFPWTWAALPNLYLSRTTFYNLPYAIAQLIGITIYGACEAHPGDVRLKFADALVHAGCGSVNKFIERVIGGDSAADNWDIAVRLIDRDVDRFEALASTLAEESPSSQRLEQTSEL